MFWKRGGLSRLAWLGWGGMTAFAIVSTGCEPSVDRAGVPNPSPREDVSPVVTEWRPSPSSKPASKALGDDCSAHGASECLSNLCVRTRSEQGLGYVCSQSCEQKSDCPESWRCVSVVPGAAESICLPPRGNR